MKQTDSLKMLWLGFVDSIYGFLYKFTGMVDPEVHYLILTIVDIPENTVLGTSGVHCTMSSFDSLKANLYRHAEFVKDKFKVENPQCDVYRLGYRFSVKQ